MIRIGLLGYGTVGQAFAEILAEQSRVQATIEVALVRDLDRHRWGPRVPLTVRPDEVVSRSELDLIVDVMGGKEPARDWILQAMAHGQSVISANKEVIAEHGSELIAQAARRRVFFAYEAAVGGGIPLLEPIKTHFSGAPVSRFVGILNGTTNFILSKLARGEDYSNALAEAQTAGYAEADPTNDLNGSDVVRKLELVVNALFGTVTNFAVTPRQGLSRDVAGVVKRVESWGWRMKLLALADRLGGTQVWPTLVPAAHRLAQVDGVMNIAGIEVYGQWFWMEGPGAGGPATALSLLADLYRGYDMGFQASRLLPLGIRQVTPLAMPWVGFAVDPDRAVTSFNAPKGAQRYPHYWMTPSMDQPAAQRWLLQNPGLCAYPLLVDE